MFTLKYVLNIVYMHVYTHAYFIYTCAYSIQPYYDELLGPIIFYFLLAWGYIWINMLYCILHLSYIDEIWILLYSPNKIILQQDSSG